MNRLADHEITRIDIVLVTGGEFHPDYTPTIDPYYDARDWHEAARGDGHSYSGCVGSVDRQPGETLDALLERTRVEETRLREELRKLGELPEVSVG